MKKIKLAIVRQKYRFDGGAEQFINRLMHAFNSNGFELNLITRKWSKNFNSKWKIHICNPYIYGRISRESSFANAARKCWQKKGFDLVQCHERISGCELFRAGDGVHQAWLEQRSRIMPMYYNWFSKFSFYHKYVLTTEKKMFNSPNLKKIICNSSMVKRDIINYYNVPSNKITIIYNAIDSKYFSVGNFMQRRIARKYFSIPYNACTLIFIGSDFVRKGLYQSISALSHTNRYLIVVGKNKYQYQYKKLAISLGCLSRIRFINILQDILPCYHAADALILPSLYDPFPNVILEAMSCGLPVITSQQCGGSELIEHGRHGFICDSLNICDLRESIVAIPLIEDNHSMGLAARERVKPYTLTKLSQQFMNLYKELL